MSIKIRSLSSTSEVCESCNSNRKLYEVEGHILCSNCIKENKLLSVFDIGFIFDGNLVH